ncbi:MAG: hypothetical protein P4L75_03345 [Clostridia bacterium]|nr:hypothetical protein [Clostridia bacterium]
MKHKKPRQKRRSRHSAAYFFTSFVLTLAVAGCGVGIFVVDKNTGEIGWRSDTAVLAISSENRKLNLTVMGNSYSVSMTPFEQTWQVIGQIRRSGDQIAPAPRRFASELLQLTASGVLKLYQKYLDDNYFGEKP